jgi:hypothetical protein
MYFIVLEKGIFLETFLHYQSNSCSADSVAIPGLLIHSARWQDAKARLREPAHGSSEAVAAARVTSLCVSFPVQRRCPKVVSVYQLRLRGRDRIGRRVCALTRIAAAFAVRFIWLANIDLGKHNYIRSATEPLLLPVPTLPSPGLHLK